MSTSSADTEESPQRKARRLLEEYVAAADLSKLRSPEEAARGLVFARAALGLAEHEVTDPFLIEVQEADALGYITVEQALSLGHLYILGNEYQGS